MGSQRQVIPFNRTVWSSCESKEVLDIGPDKPRGDLRCVSLRVHNIRMELYYDLLVSLTQG